MCGIVGFNWANEDLARRAIERIRYRGPDDSDVFVDENASLGHARLSILDLSTRGRQPMRRLNYVVTYNGEIYNFRELREQLREYTFESESDTEVLIYAYDKWGPECLEKLNGMFAFCIYDKRKEELFLARDRFGIKPLYYIDHKDKFAFASEISALRKLLRNPKIDREGVQQFFNFRFTVGETTLIKGVKKLLPSHYLIYDLKEKHLSAKKQYYALRPGEFDGTFDDAQKRIRQLMQKSVERRMVSDVPVACLLSGGIDSSIITALAKKYSDNLNTFSIGFDTTNELPFAKQVAQSLETNHHEFILRKEDVGKYLQSMIAHMDEPIGDPGFLPVFVLSEKVKQKNSVVLSGDGGDEVFCGYDRYKLFQYGLTLRKFLPFDFNSDILKRVRSMRGKEPARAFFEAIRLFDEQELGKLGIDSIDPAEYWQELTQEHVTNAQFFDLNTLLPNDFFMKADKMSSAFGLEQRVPFMDHELVEFAFSLPREWKIKGWNEKYILKKAFEHIVPKEITTRRKHGFDVPIDYWFKNELGEALERIVINKQHDVYDGTVILEILEGLRKSKGPYKHQFLAAQKLWSVLVFELWLKKLKRE